MQYSQFADLIQHIEVEASKNLNVSFDVSAESALGEYLEREDLEQFEPSDVAAALALIAWASAARVVADSVTLGQLKDATKQPNVVYATDVRRVLIDLHVPDYPGEPCSAAVVAIRDNDLVKRLLPERAREMLAEFNEGAATA